MGIFNKKQSTSSCMFSINQQKNAISMLGIVIFITAILYYCFAYALRVYPNVMEDQLLARFHTGSLGYSMLTVFYYVAYAPMQIPIGVCVDKVGPRKSLLTACLIAMVGVMLFGATNILGLALTGRFLVGLGAAFAYVTALKVATLWLPKKYFATATGIVTGCGMIAAGFTETSFTHLVQTHGIEATLRAPLYIGLTLFFLILLFIQDKPRNSINNEPKSETISAISFPQLWRYVKLIMKSKQMWLIGIIGALLYMPASVFLDAWAIPYLHTTQDLTPIQSADGAFIMLTGWIISGFIMGFVSDTLESRKIPLVIACFSATILSSCLIFTHNISSNLVFFVLFMLGFACGPHPLCFTLSKEHWTKKISGTAVAFANFVIMMGGFILQPTVGKLLNSGWSGTVLSNHTPSYSPQDFSHALAILPIGLGIATILSFFLKETYTKKRNEADELTASIQELRHIQLGESS